MPECLREVREHARCLGFQLVSQVAATRGRRDVAAAFCYNCYGGFLQQVARETSNQQTPWLSNVASTGKGDKQPTERMSVLTGSGDVTCSAHGWNLAQQLASETGCMIG